MLHGCELTIRAFQYNKQHHKSEQSQLTDAVQAVQLEVCLNPSLVRQSEEREREGSTELA